MNFLKKIKDVFVKSVPDTSPKNTVDKTDMAKVIKTGFLVGIAAMLSNLATSMAPDTFGPYQPLVILALTVSLDFINKLVKGNKV